MYSITTSHNVYMFADSRAHVHMLDELKPAEYNADYLIVHFKGVLDPGYRLAKVRRARAMKQDGEGRASRLLGAVDDLQRGRRLVPSRY